MSPVRQTTAPAQMRMTSVTSPTARRLVERRRGQRGRRRGALPPGRAGATVAGRLPAKWVIHTVGPVHAKSEDRSHLWASCHTEVLKAADELGAKTVAFPAISTGVYGYPLELAAPVAINAVMAAETQVEEV